VDVVRIGQKSFILIHDSFGWHLTIVEFFGFYSMV